MPRAYDLKLVILDRDDTIVQVPPGMRYLYGLHSIKLMEGAGEAVRLLNHRGIRVVVATNQRGVSLAEFPEMTLESVALFNERLNLALRYYGAQIDRFYVCPHDVDEGCQCRKPAPGLLLEALKDFGVLPENALVIGNSMRDLEAGAAVSVAGVILCRTESAILEAAARGLRWSRSLLEAVQGVIGSDAASDG